MLKRIIVIFLLFNFALFAKNNNEERKLYDENEVRFQKYKRILFITGFGTEKSPAFLGDSKHNQVKFQFSFKYRVFFDLYFGFTQKSFWDFWEVNNSAPFQDSNYNPELFYPINVDIYPLKVLTLGIEHESNGQSKKSGHSRSINKPYLLFDLKWNSWFCQNLKAFYYFDILFDKFGLIKDDLLENKDIYEYYGFFDLTTKFLFSKNFNIELLLRKGWSANVKKGAVQLGIDFKIPVDYLIKYGINPSFYTEFFAGYGENLMNYNEFQLRYRFGGMLSF